MAATTPVKESDDRMELLLFEKPVQLKNERLVSTTLFEQNNTLLQTMDNWKWTQWTYSDV